MSYIQGNNPRARLTAVKSIAENPCLFRIYSYRGKREQKRQQSQLYTTLKGNWLGKKRVGQEVDNVLSRVIKEAKI